MKTANKQIILLSCVLGAVIVSTSVWAGTATSSGTPSATPPTISPSVTSPPGANPALPPPPTVAIPKAVSAGNANPEIKIPDLSNALPAGKKDMKEDSVDSKVPDSVKDVIKHLNTKTEDVTLDDLNAAREAIAKLDALIDIEKRLQDLDKIRDERNKAKEKQLIDAIPKTALTPPPSFIPPPVTDKMPEKTAVIPARMAAPPPVEVDVVRIEGSNGRYGALVRDGGSVRLVHAGDHLSDGSVVLSVSTQGIEFQRDDKMHVAQIKDVQGVFGDSH